MPGGAGILPSHRIMLSYLHTADVSSTNKHLVTHQGSIHHSQKQPHLFLFFQLSQGVHILERERRGLTSNQHVPDGEWHFSQTCLIYHLERIDG